MEQLHAWATLASAFKKKMRHEAAVQVKPFARHPIWQAEDGRHDKWEMEGGQQTIDWKEMQIFAYALLKQACISQLIYNGLIQ